MSVWAIRCGTLFDGTGAAPLRDAGMIVQDGRITAVGRADATAAPAGARTLDLSQRFVMPGLIDCHTHASIVPGLGDQLGQLCRGPVPQALAATQNLRHCLGAELAWGQGRERPAELPDGSASRSGDHDVTHLQALEKQASSAEAKGV